MRRRWGERARWLLGDVERFSRHVVGRPLYPYQLEVARAVLRSVLRGAGRTFTVMFARQAGKNELSAQLEAYLLCLYRGRGGQIVKAAPTFEPQAVVSLRRLLGALDHPFGRGARVVGGYRVELGRASAAFLSAAPEANIVGQTASLLLEVDEAQDVDPAKYDRDLRPMAAARNATTVLYGTGGVAGSLLERERARNLVLEAEEGAAERAHFEVPWQVVAEHNAAYGRYVAGERERLGADHPLFLSQYELRPLDGVVGLFGPAQLALLEGEHERQRRPEVGRQYVAGVDVAGESASGGSLDAAARRAEPGRDSTVVTVAAVEWARAAAGLVLEPRLRVVEHYWWTGRSQREQVERLVALLGGHWRCVKVVVDATGLGAGLAEFLAAALGEGVVERYVFSGPSKSRLGWGLLGAVNAGRVKVYRADGSPERRELMEELRQVRTEVGANELLRWWVPAGVGHDDFVVSLALCVEAARVAPYGRAVGRAVRAAGGRA